MANIPCQGAGHITVVIRTAAVGCARVYQPQVPLRHTMGSGCSGKCVCVGGGGYTQRFQGLKLGIDKVQGSCLCGRFKGKERCPHRYPL